MVQKKLPTTVKMVDEALIELYSRKGVSVKKLCNFIESKYGIVISQLRVALIKKHLRQLKETSLVRNTTGKGLLGSIKLTDKKSFLQSIELKSSTRTKSRASKPKTLLASQVDKPYKAARMEVSTSNAYKYIYFRNLMGRPSPDYPIEPEPERIMQMTPRSSLPVEKPNVGVRRRLFR